MKIIESVWWSSSCKKQWVMLPFHHFCDETKFPENYSPLPHHPPDNSAAKYAHTSSPYWHLEQPNFIKPVLKCSKVMKNPIFTLFYDWSVKVNKVSRKRCFLTLNLITALLCHMYVCFFCPVVVQIQRCRAEIFCCWIVSMETALLTKLLFIPFINQFI